MSGDGYWSNETPRQPTAPASESERLAGRVNGVLDSVDELAWFAAQVICFVAWTLGGFFLSIMIAVSTYDQDGSNDSAASTAFCFALAGIGGLIDLIWIRPRINIRFYGHPKVLR